MKYKIFIDGQEGTTGLKIHGRLQGRKDLEILTVPGRDRKKPAARLELMKQADVTFLCLPDAASREIVSMADSEWRILDTSTAHRTDKNWVYGFPELDESQRAKIREAARVAVPGCHATGFISLVKPLVSLGITEKDYPFTCHSITGYSGGGKKMIAQYEEKSRIAALDSPRQYGLDQTHKHLPEMIKITGIEYAPAFHPIAADYFSGMLVTISLHKRFLKKNVTPQELHKLLERYYEDQNMIKVNPFGEKPEDGFLAANMLADTDGLQIFSYGHGEQIVLIACYDNLGKGASGAAIQCMNIMLDMPENTGLVI